MAGNELVNDSSIPRAVVEPVLEDLSFEGFLRKRKDTRRFTWARYWFKLQNTTLYFYMSPEAHTAALRGQYYMFHVQSVRKLNSSPADFQFEIVMKNKKKKILSADTAELRDVWIAFLWKAMQLPGPGRKKSSCTWFDIPNLLEMAQARTADGDNGGSNPENAQDGAPTENAPLPALQPDRHDDNEDTDEPNDALECNDFTTSNDQDKENDESLASEFHIYDVPRRIIMAAASGGQETADRTETETADPILSQNDPQTS